MIDIDFLVHLYDFAVQLLPFRSLDTVADGFAHDMSIFTREL